MEEDYIGCFLGALLIVVMPVCLIWYAVNCTNRPPVDTTVKTYEITDVSHMRSGWPNDCYTVSYQGEDGNIEEENVKTSYFDRTNVTVENTNLGRQWMDKHTGENGITYYTIHVRQPVRTVSEG